MKNQKRPHILITNDDGIRAPGIKQLWHSLKDFARLTVIAPAYEQSAVGLSVTIRQPLRIERAWEEGSDAWSVTGTPADCVKMALSVILDDVPNFIVSGINRGGNAGRNVLYSGTVAGAIEGTLQGIQSIAFSCSDFRDTDYSIASDYIPAIVRHVSEHPLPQGTLLNVNFPAKNLAGIKGLKLTRQGKEYWVESPDKRCHPAENHEYYWLGARLAEFQEEDDSDVMWLRKGYATAVPVHVAELTDHDHLKSLREIFEKISL